jgi:hypothetical protein
MRPRQRKMEAHSNQTFNVITPFYTRAMILRAWRAVLPEQRMRIRFAAGHCRNVPSRYGSAFSLGCFAPSSRGAWINRGVTGRIAAPSTFLSSESINSRRDVRGDGRRIRHRYLSFAPACNRRSACSSAPRRWWIPPIRRHSNWRCAPPRRICSARRRDCESGKCAKRPYSGRILKVAS